MTIRRSLLLASMLALAAPSAAAVAAPTAVDVRIEGKSSTIFSGPVTTDGKTVTTAAGGTHVCDGTNNGVSPSPVATATSALDDAAIKGGFDWDGAWFGPGYPDYFVSRIAGESETATEFWGVFVNGVAAAAGGCQTLADAGDEILWAFDAFNKTGALSLSLPGATAVDVPVVAKATDTATGAAVAGATIGSATTGADGTASLSFAQPGVYVLNADRSDLVRSRQTRICVDPPLVEACTSTDRTPPTVRNDAPRVSSSTARFGYIRLSWQGDDGPTGSGVRRYRVEQRRTDVPGRPWKPLVTNGTGTQKRVSAHPGETREFRVQAIDRAGNASPWVSRTSTMPIDNLAHELRLSGEGWRTLRRQGAFKLSVSRAPQAGASASLRFIGSGATLVTRELRDGGRLRISVDGGDPKIVSLRGESHFRKTLIGTGKLDAGKHRLRITSLGGGPVEIDAVAVRR